jgi:hypothetical protein
MKVKKSLCDTRFLKQGMTWIEIAVANSYLQISYSNKDIKNEQVIQRINNNN